MEIRNNVDQLKTLLGVSSPKLEEAGQTKSEAVTGQGAFSGDRATLSSAGTEASQSAIDSDARMEKVASIHAALAAGTYSVPSSAVAAKLVDVMLAGGERSGN
jgi:flagellar biosynthesis anti-sigma factor FlgM